MNFMQLMGWDKTDALLFVLILVLVGIGAAFQGG